MLGALPSAVWDPAHHTYLDQTGGNSRGIYPHLLILVTIFIFKKLLFRYFMDFSVPVAALACAEVFGLRKFRMD